MNELQDAEGIRRYLTLLFADLSHSTLLGERMEAEHYAALMAAFRTICRSVVPRHGGHIARIQGDGMLAFFGWPHPREDDGRRATLAALEVAATLTGIGASVPLPVDGPLGLHAGVHAGLVLVSEGDVERGRYELLGQAPNVAARLCALAGPGEVLVSEETLGPYQHHFQSAGRERMALRGRTDPIDALRVRGRSAHRPSQAPAAHRRPGPMIGRSLELIALLAALDRQRRHDAPLLGFVSAGPGLGKSRLLDELAVLTSGQQGSDRSTSHAQGHPDAGSADAPIGWRVLRGSAQPDAALPLQPFLQMAEQVVAQVTAGLWHLPRPLAERLRALTTGTAVAEWQDSAAFMATICDTLASEQPLLLLIDDWQWADEASAHLLARLAGSARIACVLAGRQPDQDLLPSPVTLRVELGPLSSADAQTLIHRLLPAADPFSVGDIERMAGGVPLFLEELCHAAMSADRPWRTTATGPAWLNGLIQSRIARLPAAQADLLQQAAVLGSVFPHWLFERLTGLRADDPAIQALTQRDFLYAGEVPGTLRFKHGLTRDVVYGGIGLSQRQALHRRIAEVLVDVAGVVDGVDATALHAESLAYHCAAAGMVAEAARHAEAAGDRAQAASALDRARHHYRAAMDAHASLADLRHPAHRETALRWLNLSRKLAMACVFDPLALPEGVGLFEHAVEIAQGTGEPHLIARAEHWLAYVLYARGRAAQAEHHGRRALVLAAQAGDLRLSAQVNAVLGQVLITAARYDEALPLIDAGLGARRTAAGAGTDALRAPARSDQADEALPPHARPSQAARAERGGSPSAIGTAYTLSCKGLLLADRGHFGAAHDCFAQSMTLVGQSRHQVASSVRHWYSLALQWQGRWDEAQEIAEVSARIAEFTRSRHQLAIGRAFAAWSAWQAHGREADLQTLRDATAWAEQRGGRLGMSLNHGWLIEAELQHGQARVATRHLRRLLAGLRAHDFLGAAVGLRAWARHAARHGDHALAAHCLSRAGQVAERRQSAHEAAQNLLCRAELALARSEDAAQVAQARRDAATSLLSLQRMGVQGPLLARARGLAAGDPLSRQTNDE